MLPDYLQKFNEALQKFREKFPTENWLGQFKDSLINDYSFYSARIEDEKLQYGDTIKFLNNELIRKGKMSSLLNISNHKEVLKSLLDKYDNFELNEDLIKSIHRDLMDSELAWETNFRPELIGQYRNIPVVGSRQPFFEDKEYTPHFNLDIAMASHINLFNNKLLAIDNDDENKHLITALSYFHNNFLNKLHPFADGNGRVCRIIMGGVMMKHNCPPIFPHILEEAHRFDYIAKIIECEQQNSNLPLVKFLSEGMTVNLLERYNM